MSRIRRIISLVAVAALLVAVGGFPSFAGHLSSGVGSFTGCLDIAGKGTGKVSKIQAGDAPIGTTCPNGFTPIHLSGGDVTAIQSGTGLSGGDDEGDITLAIVPSFRLPQGCTAGDIATYDFTNSEWDCQSQPAALTVDDPLTLIGGVLDVGNCSTNQILKFSAGEWACAADTDTNSGGTVTQVNTGTGLTGGPISSTGTLSLVSSFRLPQTCTTGDFTTWNGTTWACATLAADITGVTAGTGLSGGASSGNATLDIASNYRLPQSCAPASVALFDGSTWRCGAPPGSPAFSTSLTEPTGTISGSASSVAVGADGLPIISELRSGLSIVHCGNPGCTTGNTITNVSTNVTFATAVTIGSDGLPFVAYVDAVTNQIKGHHCTDVACASGTTSPIDNVNASSQDIAVAVGTDGFPMIAYRDGSNGLGYAHCGNVTCSSQAVITLDFDPSDYVAIASGSDGLPLIVYRNTASGDLESVHCGDLLCSTGNTPGVVESAISPFSHSLTIGDDGLPVVSVLDSGGFDLYVVHCGTIDCTAGNVSTNVANNGVFSSIAIGSDGLPVVSYQDSDADLFVTHCAQVTCTSATTVMAAAEIGVGSKTSIAIGPDGFPVITYRSDSPSQHLMVAHCSSVFCVPHQRRR